MEADGVPVPVVLDQHRLLRVVVPLMMLAGVACARAAPTTLPESSGVASPLASASSASPALPQADDLTFGQDAGRVLIGLTSHQVQSRMHQLHTYRVDETLGPATPPLRATYSFEAPDRMQLSFANGGTTVWVGPTRYTRGAASGAWVMRFVRAARAISPTPKFSR
jgi:hypothetical protein